MQIVQELQNALGTKTLPALLTQTSLCEFKKSVILKVALSLLNSRGKFKDPQARRVSGLY
jgi:hypothetical protein